MDGFRGLILVPLFAWVVHLALAGRGRRYPVVSLLVVIVLTISVMYLSRWLTGVLDADWRGLEREEMSATARQLSSAWLMGFMFAFAIFPLEILVAAVWAIARYAGRKREVAARRQRMRDAWALPSRSAVYAPRPHMPAVETAGDGERAVDG